ncbi:hypothetical protein [Psychromicrobium xiongbiense]|uniref:hypothetical protein n=1 Tax=Psychromicrobium xiongbiense TaxID=3051184 RepID=UPI002553447C|nr:hypothetical protein [Psychromicrobium sp. YIM S02556]
MTSQYDEVQIVEVDDRGEAVPELAAEQQTYRGPTFNPWLIALWAFAVLQVLLAIVGMVNGSTPTYASSFTVNGQPIYSLERPWYSYLVPYAFLLVPSGVATAVVALALHATAWERRRRQAAAR